MAARNTLSKSVLGLGKLIARAARRSSRSLLLALFTIASLLVLTGCGSSASTVAATSNAAIMPALKLALGTLDLEDTDQAVDAASAARLLPLWQLLDQLETSGSAAPAEITAVVEQIESEMAPSQLKAIEAMNLKDSDVTKASLGSGASAATGTITTGSASQAVAAADPALGGNLGGGGVPLDGGGPMAAPASQQGNSNSNGSTSASEPSLVKQVIQLLESKIQG